MKLSIHLLAATSIAFATFAFAALAPASWAIGAAEDEREGPEISKKSEGKTVYLKDARLKIELNATDGDAGIQVFIDADPWKTMDIYDPYGKHIFRATAQGRFAKQGGTELFMESAEPNFSQLTLEKFLKRFPEGSYYFRGKGLEGENFIGTAALTHNLAAGPELVSPIDGATQVDPNHAVMTWKPVSAANGSPIIGYEVLIVQRQSSFPAIPKVALDIMMPATATSLAVPPGFLLRGTEYEWEVLAIEAGGNQTLSTAFFRTAP